MLFVRRLYSVGYIEVNITTFGIQIWDKLICGVRQIKSRLKERLKGLRVKNWRIHINMGKKENEPKIEVVKFLDGTFAVRKDDIKSCKGKDCYEYLSIDSGDCWWYEIIDINKFCKGSKRRAIKAYKKYNQKVRDDKDAGTPIKEEYSKY